MDFLVWSRYFFTVARVLIQLQGMCVSSSVWDLVAGLGVSYSDCVVEIHIRLLTVSAHLQQTGACSVDSEGLTTQTS